MKQAKNLVFLQGRLGSDPVIRFTPETNMPVVVLYLFQNIGKLDKKTGEWINKANMNRIVLYGEKNTKAAMNYFKKGTYIQIEGKLRTHILEGTAGKKSKFMTEVVVNDFDLIETPRLSHKTESVELPCDQDLDDAVYEDQEFSCEK